VNVYGTPPAVIALSVAAAARATSAHKRGACPADMEALQAGITTGLKVYNAPAFDAAGHDCARW